MLTVASYTLEQVDISKSSTVSAMIMPRMNTWLNKDLDQDLEEWGFALEAAAKICRCDAVDLVATVEAHLHASDDPSQCFRICHMLKYKPTCYEAKYA